MITLMQSTVAIMLFRGVAHTPNDMRGFEWVPILGGITVLAVGIKTRNKYPERRSPGDIIAFSFLCVTMIALGIWSLFRR